MKTDGLITEELVPAAAIAATIYLAGRVVLDGDGQTDEQRAAREQTQTGAPTDTPGQQLPGVPDYIKVFIGQQTKALRDRGALPESSSNGKVLPVTTRRLATQVLDYWRDEINRLCGFADDKLDPSGSLLPLKGGQQHASPLVPTFALAMYDGVVSFDSAAAIVRGWNRWVPAVNHAIAADVSVFGSPVSKLDDPMSAAATEEFWEAIRGLAIAVDVDRAVPDHAGYLWIALGEEALALPGRVGELAADLAEQAAGGVLGLAWNALKPIVFSPLGLAAIGFGLWLYRAELGAFARRLKRV